MAAALPSRALEHHQPENPMTSKPSVDGADVAPARFWNTLDELRGIALTAGCTKAQFQDAVETVGDDPHKVATYLQRYVTKWKLPVVSKTG